MKELRALTSLRGIAAMMVVMQHFSATAERHAVGSIPSLVPHGYMAVDLFFVLSGFIMAYTYQADFARRGNRAMPSFLLKRAARILPLNTAVVALIVCAGAASQSALGRNIFFTSADLPWDILCNLLLLQGFGLGMNLIGPSWSICTEFAAYLLFPILLALAFCRRALILAPLCGLVCAALLAMALGNPRLGLSPATIGGELILCFTQLFLGLVTFRVSRAPATQAVLRQDWAALLAALWIAACLLLRLDLPAALGFPFIVAALACNTGRVAAWLGAGPLYFLGEISFSIYLLHDMLRPMALELVRSLYPARLETLPALGFALVASLTVIPPAWAAYVLIERPGRRLPRGVVPLRLQPA